MTSSSETGRSFSLIYQPTGIAVARVVRLDGWWAKGRGVIGLPSLAPGEGIWLPGVAAVHTFFVGFPLDLLFLDRDLRLRRAVESVPPWCPLVRAGHSRHTIELGAGTLAQKAPGARPGDSWLLERSQ